MILQALTERYETLTAEGRLPRDGWSDVPISFALYLREDGTLEDVVSLKQPEQRGKKEVLVPRKLSLPAPVKRTVGIAPNFLWDNSSYLLGADQKGSPARSLECFAACKKLHHELLDPVDSPAARAVLAFFDRWDPAAAQEHPALAGKLEEVLGAVNLAFRWDGGFVQDDPLIQQAWQAYYSSVDDGPEMTCLITGKKGPAQKVHPSIKGVVGAQSSGAALVSFNSDALCSYGHEQNLNAPVSKYAAFAYTTALNAMLADRAHLGRIGDATVLFWAQNGKSAYQDFFRMSLFEDTAAEANADADGPDAQVSLFDPPGGYSAADLQRMMLDLCRGQSVVFDETQLDPDATFYILGLSPNAARLSVRFFLRNSFGHFLQNIQAHNERLAIVKPKGYRYATIPVWRLLSETVNQKSSDKSPAPGLAGEMLQAVLNDTRYPATLLNGMTLRIRAEREVNCVRAAILKAYYLKNSHREVPKEVLTVSLNPESTNIPYVLGRLFSVYEAIQTAANPGINATIKDKYFNSAAATPASIFPILGGLAQKHLKKLRGGNRGLCVMYEKQLSELAGLLGETFPARMSLPQQGSFQLGYYQQTQARYQKKEEE